MASRSLLLSPDDDRSEAQGPTVDSENPEERIKARRLRIQARLEAEKREARGDKLAKQKPLSESDSKANRKSRQQIEKSRQRLEKLKADGTELVTNVGVAADAREMTRRDEEDRGEQDRKERLEAEAKASEERFEEISKRWETLRPKAGAEELHSLLKKQKAACDAMIDEKNKLINELQQMLKLKDDHYVKDLKQQADDVDLTIERMEDQIKTLSKAHRAELQQVEKSYEMERGELLAGQEQKWESLMQQRRDMDRESLEAKRRRVEENERALEHLRTQYAEDYNKIKIKMEKDVETLEQELQAMKATFQLNLEKLDYNFQVLKKRDEENTITKSQQKRKITRLQDSLNHLKTRNEKMEKQFKEENASLTEDYRRLSDQFKKLQEKSKHFQATDLRRYVDIWEMNEQKAIDLREKILEADQITHVQQLGLPWTQPEPLESPLQQWASAVKGDPETPSAVQVAAEALQSGVGPSEGADGGGDVLSSTARRSTLPLLEKGARPMPNWALKKVLELICDESGFMVEDKLARLLAPLERDEQSLMKLDSIFKALGIETEADVHLLASYFLTDPSPPDGEGTADENQSQLAVTTDDFELIHPNNVVETLRRFAEDFSEGQRAQSKKQASRSKTIVVSTDQINREISLDPAYWEKIACVIASDKERMWDGLVEGLEKYHQVLGERATLIHETESLRQQNTELRMLLNQYLMSRINQELEIPPTKTLTVDFVRSRPDYA
ncbi:dynein regulatory complex protein 1-like [Oscarella lobularis]|uniref:dynein regulatory complex protein 1-like n=1 Tax=Oscarella lobularis TaxID=121494 RepID=UPI003313D139